MISPLPGQIFGLSAGYLFGFWPGLVYANAGLLVGSAAAMLIGRLIGRGLARRPCLTVSGTGSGSWWTRAACPTFS